MAKDCNHCETGEAPDEAAAVAPSSTGARLLRLRIEQMDCPAEEALVRKALVGQAGIGALSFDFINRTLTISDGPVDPAQVVVALAGVGLRAEPLAAGNPDRVAAAAPASRISSHRQWLLSALAGVAAIGSEVAAYASGTETSWVVAALALTAVALGGRETLRKGWIALRSFTLNIHLLMMVAVTGAVLIGEWPEAAVVIWLFGLAELIERASLDRARNAIRGLLDLAPEKATVREADGRWVEVGAETVLVGTVVRVRPSERIALDGLVAAGESTVNQAPITGESMPVNKSAGDPVFAGTINERGVLEIRVTAPKGESTLDRIARSVQDAQGQRAPTQRFVDRFARVYTPIVFAVALLMALVPPLAFGLPWLDWIYKALVLLVVACPCALVISTPVTVVSGLAAAARRGMVIKGGLYLEQGRQLAFLALDKTGTLTHGKPVLTDVVPVGELDKEDALRLAASLEALSEHPIAAAILTAYGTRPHAEVRKFEALPGKGAKGEIDGTTYYLGNHRLAEELRVCSPELEAVLDRLETEAKTAVVLATASQPLAVLAVTDEVRSSAREVIAELKALGVTAVMLTGDNVRSARAVSAKVGIDDFRSDLLPQHKLAAIDGLLARGTTGMVGDGVNDAPALAKADIGFAMGAAGTDTAIETADVALMQDDLRKLPEFIRLSRATAAILWQNITLALGIKLIFFVLALTGDATLWMAVFADMGASIIVVFNGLRLLRQRT